MSVECISIFKYFFSANQVLFYAHTSLVKLYNLFENVNNHPEKFDDYEFLQEAQTEANFFIFTFLQTILPYRDLIKKTKLLHDNVFDGIFKNNDEFDFFISLRNLQTHVVSPVFTWSVYKNFIDKKTYFDVELSNKIFDYIKSDMHNSKKSFKNGGYDFIIKNKKNKIYRLANDFLDHLYLIHKYCYEVFLLKYKKDIDECEYFLKKGADYTRSCTEFILKKSMPDFKEKGKIEQVSSRYCNILRELGCEPKLMKDFLIDTISLQEI